MESNHRSQLTESQVIQHHSLPDLNILLCGRSPEIYSARDRPRRYSIDIAPPSEPQSARSPRFSRVPPNWVPGQVPHFNRPDVSAVANAKQSRLIGSVREAEEFTQSLSDKLQAYRTAHQVKAVVHERDFEDHFAVPLQNRLRAKMTRTNYNKYLIKKEQLIRNLDAHPVPIRSPRALPPVPRIEVSARGLRDPKNRFVERQAIEERLDDVINYANGVTVAEKKTPGVKTLDYKLFSVLYQTRFFFGNDPEKGNRAGVKVFAGSGSSRVGNVMDLFSET